eukprot:3654242-Amphidinium_carterae.3
MQSKRSPSSKVGGRSSKVSKCSITPSQLNGVQFKVRVEVVLSTKIVATVFKKSSRVSTRIGPRALDTTARTSPVARRVLVRVHGDSD